MFSGSSNHGYGFDSNYSELSGAAAAREAASIYDVKNGDEIKARRNELMRLVKDSELMQDRREKYYKTQYERMKAPVSPPSEAGPREVLPPSAASK